MAWRYYAQRGVSGLWVDNNVQLLDPEFSFKLSAPNSGQASIPAGLTSNTRGSDGLLVWRRYDTLLYAEEDGQLDWVGVCTAANPDAQGLHLEFVGVPGLLQKIPFTDVYRTWHRDAFDVVRHLLTHSNQKPQTPRIVAGANKSKIFVGDPNPPAKPTKPTRKKGETQSEFEKSARYKSWDEKQKAWTKKWGDNKQYELLRWENPYVGEEIDNLARENGFDYREEYRWVDKANKVAEFKMVLDVTMGVRRDDIAFIDGVNLASPLDPKDGGDTFANRVIGTGAGEGQKMVRVTVGGNDGRFMQALYSAHKNIKDPARLRKISTHELGIYRSGTPEIDTVEVWDMPGFADIKTLNVGDEVRVSSGNVSPAVNVWVKITGITRRPQGSTSTLELTRA